MKINYEILTKAFIDTVKPILYGVTGSVAFFALVVFCVVLAGKYAPLLFIAIGLSICVGIVVHNRYISMMDKHQREQQHIVDVLKR